MRNARLWTRITGFTLGLLGAGLAVAANPLESSLKVELPPVPLARFAPRPGVAVPPAGEPSLIRRSARATGIRQGREIGWNRGGFYHRHLAPRLQRQLRSVGPVAHWLPGGSGSDTRYFREEISPRIERTFESGARKAVKDYLLEITGLGASIDRFRSRRGSGDGGSGAKGDRRISTGFGISHGLPRLEVGMDTGSGSLRFEVGLTGNASLEYRPVRHRETRFGLGYDLRSGSLIAGGRIVY